MRDCLDHWTQADVAPRDLRLSLHYEKLALGLAADEVLPNKRMGDNYASHLHFARFLTVLPEEGAVFTRRADLIGPAYRLIIKAIKQGQSLFSDT